MYIDASRRPNCHLLRHCWKPVLRGPMQAAWDKVQQHVPVQLHMNLLVPLWRSCRNAKQYATAVQRKTDMQCPLIQHAMPVPKVALANFTPSRLRSLKCSKQMVLHRHGRERHMCMQCCPTQQRSHKQSGVAGPCKVNLHAASLPCHPLRH